MNVGQFNSLTIWTIRQSVRLKSQKMIITMKKTAIILAMAGAGVAMSAQASSPQPFKVQDLVKINKLHSSTLSSDGNSIVFGIKKFDAEGKASSDLYIQDLTQMGSEPKQLTFAAGTEHSAAFSADDQSVYFLASRDGSSQLYKLPLTGGEARQVSDLPLDVEGFKLSQDGKQVVLNMRVFPDCQDLKCSEDKFTAEAERKSNGREYKQLMIRHWDTWSDNSRSHLFVAQLNGDKITTAVDVTAGLDTETPPHVTS